MSGRNVPTRADERVRITLAGKRIRRRLYGVGRCYVAGRPAVAVKAGRYRHINTRLHAINWLTTRGLSFMEAKTFVRDGLRLFDDARRGRHLLSCVRVEGVWLCAADCPHHLIVDAGDGAL